MSEICCHLPVVERGDAPAYRGGVLWTVLGVNLAMFMIEMIAGFSARSVSLPADSLDFLGDTANCGISLFVAGMAVLNRAMAAFCKGVTMGLLGMGVLASSVWRGSVGPLPEAVTMGVVGFAALAANALCFALLSGHRSGDSNMRSVWLCSRNDLIGNCAVLASALGVAGSGAVWPDVLVAAIMAVLALQGRRRHAGSCRDRRIGRMRGEVAWLLAAVIAAAAFGQQPQATIRVEVTAQSVPVQAADVTVNGKSIRTGQDGTATTVAPLGDVKVSVTKDGYFPANASLLADAAREWVVHVELEPQKAVEEQIRVYATRNDVRIQDSPLHVEVLQREEVEEKMLMTPGDIVMMLNEMGGMRVQTTSPSLGAASVRVQGMRGRCTSFLSDGLPLFGQQGAGLGLLQIPPMDLGQVEVIKGNASALYGGAAMAGVVNLISRRSAAEPVHEFLVNRSTLGATDGSMFLASPLTSHWSASLLGSGDWQEHRDVDGDGWADLAGYSRGVIRPRFFWDDKNGRAALLTGGITYENRSGGTMPGATLRATGEPYTEALNTRRYDFGGNVQWLIENRYVVTARFSATEQQHRHQFGEVIENDRHELMFGEVSVKGTFGRNTWVAGAAAQRDAYRPLDVPRFAYTYVVPGVFVQDDVSIAPWLSVSASARADFHNRYGVFLSPRVSALLRWAGFTSRLSAGQGFFTPTPLTEETEAAGLSRLSLPVPLVAERGRSASVDLTRSLRSFSLTTTLFASNISHPIFVDRGDAYRVINLPAPTRNRGAELLATWQKAPFSATASYTYVRSSELDPVAGRAEVPLTPRHSFGLVGMWEKEGVARFGVECYYTGQQRLEYNPYRAVSSPYVIFGAMGERKMAAHVKLFLNLENLGNVRQSRWDPMLLPSRAVDGRWTVDAWAPLDGRVINGGVRFMF